MRRPPALLFLAAVVALSRAPAAAVVAFQAPEYITGYGDDGDVATDGAGTWIVAVDAAEVFGCCNSEIAYVRSTDGALTWDPIARLSDELMTGEGADTSPQLAGDGGGNWVAVWNFNNATFQYDLLVATSADNGMSWSATAMLEPSTTSIETVGDVATDGAGTWIASWIRSGTPSQVYVSRSTDDGSNWTSTLVGPGAGTGFGLPRIATDDGGTWVVVWPATGPGGDVDASFVRSTDGGLSWSTQAFLDTGAAADEADDRFVDVAADASGNWLAAWSPGFCFGPSGTILGARSSDGLTWTAPTRLDVPTTPGGACGPVVATTGADEWVVAWWSFAFRSTLGTDSDALFVRSRDGGVTWSPPAALNPDASRDNGTEVKQVPRSLEADVTGTWVAVYWWWFDAVFQSSVYYVTSRPDCPAAPAGTCKQTLASGASRINIIESPNLNDLLVWSWRGEETNPLALGDPQLAGRGFVLCLYDETAGSPALVFEDDAPAGETCGYAGEPCWTPTTQGFKYRDRKNVRGGITEIDLRSGLPARVKVRAAGFSVTPPFMPLDNDTTLRAQLHNLDTGACWEGSYSAPRGNTATRYRASSD